MEIINTIFQVLFVAIMSIGILGLPLFFYLNARKRRIYKESPEMQKDNDNDDNNDNTDNT